MGKKRVWGRKSQKTLGERNFRNGKSELVPARSSCLEPGPGIFVVPFGWPIPHSLLNFSVFFFFPPEGLFIVLSSFFFLLHKVLTHVANGCMLVVCLIILPL